mmetsp:Transcript_17626/g.23799  ORF Transcript_17626/g.23799 Transcript_17626/m.23799 type:complete len:178 (+) Transcript_17626:46-579(+)
MAASFHAYICMLQWLTCLTGFVYGLVSDDYPWLWYTSLIAIFVMPIINEILLCLKGYCLKSRVTTPDQNKLTKLDSCVPIVYSTGYNIHAFGAEKLHPFDASKYRRVFADLLDTRTIDSEHQMVHSPSIPSREFLQNVMSTWYLFTLNYSIQIMRCIELPVFFVPSWILRMRILDCM